MDNMTSDNDFLHRFILEMQLDFFCDFSEIIFNLYGKSHYTFFKVPNCSCKGVKNGFFPRGPRLNLSEKIAF